LLVREGYGFTFLRGGDPLQRILLGCDFGPSTWLPDGRRFVGADVGRVVAYDTFRRRKLGTIFQMLTDENYLTVGPTGHYRGTPDIRKHIVYVAMLDDGSQQTFTPAQFDEKFGWKNDPNKATFLKLDP